MRLLTVALGLALTSPVCAQAQSAVKGLAPAPSNQSLSDVAFVNRAPVTPSDPLMQPRGVQAAAAFGEVLPTPAFLGESLSGQPRLASSRVAAAGEGLIAARWIPCVCPWPRSRARPGLAAAPSTTPTRWP